MANETSGRGRAALVEGGVEFDERDAALLRAVARTGSVAAAASELGRSRARALRRIETLEAAFGGIVERRRGGSDGGGSRLTENGARLLDRYDRLQAVLEATASVPETVLGGSVTSVDGELAEVNTDVGTLRGLHDGVEMEDDVHVRIGADDVTVHDPGTVPASDSTSARNRLRGRIADIGPGETVLELVIDAEGIRLRALITEESATRLGLGEGREVVATWKATATRLVRSPRAPDDPS